MSNFYKVIQIDSSQINNPENMGSKNKFWYKSKQDTTKWLFKYCRKNTGEHWEEKVAAEIGRRHSFLRKKLFPLSEAV